MGLRINNNVEAFNAHRQLSATSLKQSKSMEKLASGSRINRAGDDAAGLAISEKMRGQINGLAQAQRNAQDGVSLVQTGEGALNEVHSMLQRVRELKVQHLNGTLSADDKKAITAEVVQLGKEIKDIADKTEFNGNQLLNSNGTKSFQVGANDGETVTVQLLDVNGASGATNGTGAYDVLQVAAATGASSGTVTQAEADLTAQDTAFASLTLAKVDAAIVNISKTRSDFGAIQNRLEHRLNNISTYQENLVASESRIRDADMAAEMVQFSKLGILQQAGTSMLAQANQNGQGVLSLLR